MLPKFQTQQIMTKFRLHTRLISYPGLQIRLQMQISYLKFIGFDRMGWTKTYHLHTRENLVPNLQHLLYYISNTSDEPGFKRFIKICFVIIQTTSQRCYNNIKFILPGTNIYI